MIHLSGTALFGQGDQSDGRVADVNEVTTRIEVSNGQANGVDSGVC